MTGDRKPLIIAAAFAAIYVLWGSTYLAVAVALHSFPPFLLMATRSLTGGLILLAIAWGTGASIGTVRTCIFAVLCGLLLFVGCHGVLAYAQQRVPSGLAAVLLATIPFWIAILSAVVPAGDRPPAKRLLFLVPGFAGVGLIAWRQLESGEANASDILILLGASASWAIGTMVSKLEPDPVSPLSFSGMQLIAGGLALFVISAVLGEFRSHDPWRSSVSSWAAWAYLTVAGTVIAFVAYTWLLKQVDATLVATYTFVNPIIAVLLGWAVLGERPTGWTLAGATLVLIAVGALLHLQRSPEGRKTES
jgi:drug/metabolite transporter (DMT)-like permease